MTDLDLDAIEARTNADRHSCPASIRDARALVAEVRRLTSLVHAREAWIDGAKVDLDGYDHARAERDAYLAALGAIASLPSASITVRDIARHALLNGGAS